jgi:hypothetical protein
VVDNEMVVTERFRRPDPDISKIEHTITPAVWAEISMISCN